MSEIFTPTQKELVVFVGYADDAKDEAASIKSMEGELTAELKHVTAHIADKPFHSVRVFLWGKDAESIPGGQSTLINDWIEWSQVAVFVFKTRIGNVTKDELEKARDRDGHKCSILAMFPRSYPYDKEELVDEKADEWALLCKYKRELSKDWQEEVRNPLRPMEPYSGIGELKQLVLDQFKRDINRIVQNGRDADSGGDKAIKQNDITRVKTDAELRIAYEHTVPLLRPCPGATVDSINLDLVAKYAKAVTGEEISNRSQLERFARENCFFSELDPAYLHCAATLCFCNHPENFIPSATAQFVVGDITSSEVERNTISGPLSEQISNIISLITKNIKSISLFSDDSGVRQDRPEIPRDLIRELASNAVIHRTYLEATDNIKIRIKPDRLEIENPGVFPDAFSWDQLIKSDSEESYLHKESICLSNYLKQLGGYEQLGRGFAIFRDYAKENGPDSIGCKTIQNLRTRIYVRRATPASHQLSKTLSDPHPIARGGGGRRRREVFISSTSIDLPAHRKQVAEACLRMGYFPVGMEHWPAQDVDAEAVCLRNMDRCDLFIGVYAFRYGWIPPGSDLSIAELEYERAKALGIPRLLFFADDNHPWPPKSVDRGEAGNKLEAFKQRVHSERVGTFFTTEKDLRGLVLQALTDLDKSSEATANTRDITTQIPNAPAPYIVHPYVLMQSRRLVGREAELSLLTDWVAKPGSAVYQNPILSFIAIGGMGKSALTWHFFNQIAANEIRSLAGRLWWSFYERDAGFEQFVPHALAYCSGRSLDEIRRLDLHSQMDQLWQVLDARPFLIVLDGLERILAAYNRLDAARMLDDNLDEATANRIADAHGLPAGAGETYLAKHRMRACTDPRAGRFLRQLASLRHSRILISSRLYPAELQTPTAQPIPGSFVGLQSGLTANDALALWRELGVSGARDQLLPLFESINFHPLLTQALAREVANWRAAPGDFAAWQRAHPGLYPAADLDLHQRQSHILANALHNLEPAQRQVLNTLAGFRMSTDYGTLRALLVGEGNPCPDEAALDLCLLELEDRGLLGWERKTNRYELHPIVRGVVWGGLRSDERQTLLQGLEAHFAAQPMVEDWKKVESLADLQPAIEHYHILIALGRYQEATELFRDRIDLATLYRLSASRRRLELLRGLFPDGEQALPRMIDAHDQSWALNALALSYKISGQPGAAMGLLRQGAEIDVQLGDKANHAVDLYNLSNIQYLCGALQGAETSALQALGVARELGYSDTEAVSLYILGNTLSARGEGPTADQALEHSIWLFQKQSHQQFEGHATSCRAELALYQNQAEQARQWAERAKELAAVDRHERDFIRAARLQGTAALRLHDLALADERLHHALQRARAVDLAEEELPALVALAELRRRQGDPAAAREYLEQVWEPAERGPYPLFHADALNGLAQIERDAGNTPASIAAATEAYKKSWCDGPPYAYHWGLETARKHLRELGAPEPEMPQFDPSQHEPMPEVEIDPEPKAKRKPGAKGKKSRL